MINTSVK